MTTASFFSKGSDKNDFKSKKYQMPSRNDYEKMANLMVTPNDNSVYSSIEQTQDYQVTLPKATTKFIQNADRGSRSVHPGRATT